MNASQTAWLIPFAKRPPVPDCSHVEKAAYITARGRIQWHRMVTARGGDDAVYGDTDSCFSTLPRDERDGVGSGLGAWSTDSGCTGRVRDFAALAPKLYRYDAEKVDGSWSPKLRAKGIALPRMLDALARDGLWSELASGRALTVDSGVKSLRQAIRADEGYFVRRKMSRRANPVVQFGDRIPDGRGGSRPPAASELEPWNERDAA